MSQIRQYKRYREFLLNPDELYEALTGFIVEKYRIDLDSVNYDWEKDDEQSFILYIKYGIEGKETGKIYYYRYTDREMLGIKKELSIY